MSFPKKGSPEMPKIVQALAEKVSMLAPWQQHAITYCALGFWDGVDIPTREREDLAASSAMPQK